MSRVHSLPALMRCPRKAPGVFFPLPTGSAASSTLRHANLFWAWQASLLHFIWLAGEARVTR